MLVDDILDGSLLREIACASLRIVMKRTVSSYVPCLSSLTQRHTKSCATKLPHKNGRRLRFYDAT